MLHLLNWWHSDISQCLGKSFLQEFDLNHKLRIQSFFIHRYLQHLCSFSTIIFLQLTQYSEVCGAQKVTSCDSPCRSLFLLIGKESGAGSAACCLPCCVRGHGGGDGKVFWCDDGKRTCTSGSGWRGRSQTVGGEPEAGGSGPGGDGAPSLKTAAVFCPPHAVEDEGLLYEKTNGLCLVLIVSLMAVCWKYYTFPASGSTLFQWWKTLVCLSMNSIIVTVVSGICPVAVG